MKKNRPVYVDDCSIPLTAYMGPRRAGKRRWYGEYGKHPADPAEGYPSFITDEVFEDYKAAGLTFLMPEGDAYYMQNTDPEKGFFWTKEFVGSDLYHFMQMSEKHGLEVYPADERVFGNMTHKDGPFGEEEKAILREFVTTLQQHFPKTFAGVMLTDEPGIASIGRVKKIMEYLRSDEIRAIKPDLKIFSSMLPNYARLESYQAGYIYPDNAKPVQFNGERARIYAGYIDACADATGEFSFDFYPLGEKGHLSPGFYQNLEQAARAGRDQGFPISVTLQSFRMDAHYRDTKKNVVIYRAPNYEDIRWQVYSSLAFGVRSIGWFTFWQHYSEGVERFREAMVMYDSAEPSGYRKTGIYEAVKKVNAEIKAIDHIFLRFQWKGCKKLRVSNERNMRLLKADYKGGSLTEQTADNDTLIGCFENPEDGAEGYWIVNASNPYHYQKDNVTLRFADADRALVYRKGIEYDLPLTDGMLKLDLGCGEGAFVIPYQA